MHACIRRAGEDSKALHILGKGRLLTSKWVPRNPPTWGAQSDLRASLQVVHVALEEVYIPGPRAVGQGARVPDSLDPLPVRARLLA